MWGATAAPPWWLPPASNARNTPTSASTSAKRSSAARSSASIDACWSWWEFRIRPLRPRSNWRTLRKAWAQRRCNCWRRCVRSPVRPRRPTSSPISRRWGAETPPPFRLFSNPGPGADVSIADTIALAKLPSVQLIKESSRDLARVSRLIVEIDRAGHARYFTTMQMLLATLELGGSGATMPPPASEIARHIIDAFAAKDHERAAALQLEFALFPSN